MKNIQQYNISSLIEDLKNGNITSYEIVKNMLEAIKKYNQYIGAYLFINEEEALKCAQIADDKRASGDQGKLLGIPIAIKDLINVKGQPCTCSSKILEGYISPYDATVISNLRNEGAILLGRVNMDEFAMGSSTENSALGITSNPWNINYVPGGSSGGSAAAVGGHLALASLGSDTGGSIRQPAAFCGCVGLKPTYGRVSRYGLTAFASSLDQIGPLSKTVEDAALLLEVIAGYDANDATSKKISNPNYSECLKNLDFIKGLKIGLPKEYFIDGLNLDVKDAVLNAADHYKSLGAEIVDVSLPHAKYAIAVYYILATAEASANLARFDGIRYGLRKDEKNLIDLYKNTRSDGFGDEVKRRIILGTYVLSSGYYDAYYKKAQSVRLLIKNDFKKVFEDCDVLLSPVTPTPAYIKGEKVSNPLSMYLDDILTTSVNLAGNCALSIPCGMSSDGLPIGLQIIGDMFEEELVLKVGHIFEKTTEWHNLKPEMNYE